MKKWRFNKKKVDQQLTHFSEKFQKKKFPVVLILDQLCGPANIGSIFRLADAFNIEKIILCGPKIDLAKPRLQKTARATLSKIDFEHFHETADACTVYSKNGYSLLGLEITKNSQSLDDVEFSQFPKIALVLGNEIVGIEKEILNMMVKNIHINMFGENSSMNVAQALAIALYEITKSFAAIK